MNAPIELYEHRRPTFDGGWDSELARFLMPYKFAIDEVCTKLNVLREEFAHLHDYNPIEHITSRLKGIESIREKAIRRGCGFEFESIRATIFDIAGVRITCAFISDVYTLFDLFTRQHDITVVEVEDYIAEPKPNGYRSLHAIVEVPVYLSTGPLHVPVEMQFRTVAMDFWASLEHKIYYKYDRELPGALYDELCEAAATATALDEQMQRLHRVVHTTSPDDAAVTHDAAAGSAPGSAPGSASDGGAVAELSS